MILVVGDVMNDIVVEPCRPEAAHSDTPAAIATRPGGSGANVACWLGHLGGAVAFAGRVGAEDAASHAAALRAHGVIPRLGIDPALPTGRVVAIVEPDGERRFYTDRGANAALAEATLPSGLLDGVAWLHVSGHALLAAAATPALHGLVLDARRRGIGLSIDAGSATWLRRPDAPSRLRALRPIALCIASAEEASLLPLALAEILVVTEGRAGARATVDGVCHRIEAPDADIVDGIGAGDAFTAGFLLAWRETGRVRDGLAAGALTARRGLGQRGGRPPLSRSADAG